MRKTSALLAALAALASLATACGGSTTASQSSKVDQTPVVFGSDSTPDQAYLPMLMALDTMKKEGYNVQPSVQLNSSDLVIQALSNNQVQFYSSGVIAEAAAVDKGVNMKVITARGNNMWSLVATKDITSCSQLDGKKMGLFSTGGTSTVYVNIYFSQNCPNVKPQYLIIADSNLRAQALSQGQIVAAPLEGDGTATLTQRQGDKFHVLVNFGQAMPGIGRDMVVTNSEMLTKHPTVVQAFIKAQLQAIRDLYKNTSLVAKNDGTYLKLGADADLIAKYYADSKVWCANGGLETADMDAQLKAFIDYKKIPATITTAKFVDDGPMKAVLKDLGTSNLSKC